MGIFARIPFLILLLAPGALQAAPLAADHLLFPADQEFIFVSGIGDPISVSRAGRALERCGTEKENAVDRDLCAAHDFILSGLESLKDFDWQSVDGQVVFFGERHPDQEIKKYLADILPELKAQGIDTLGLEMFNSVYQPLIDDFLNNRVTADELEQALVKQWTYESQGYIKILSKAKALGFKVLALDDREQFKDNTFFTQIQKRDEHMAAIIAGHIASTPQSRVAVLTGRLHAYKRYSIDKAVITMPEVLRSRYGLTTRSLVAFGAKDRTGFNAMQMHMHGEEATGIVALPEDYPYADYVLFLR